MLDNLPCKESQTILQLFFRRIWFDMIDSSELSMNVLSGLILSVFQLFNGANVAEFDLLQGITQGLEFIQLEYVL